MREVADFEGPAARPARAAGSSRLFSPPVAIAGAAAIALRLPLLLLPGPGRDEAAYAYWAHHPKIAYAPLLQLFVRLFEQMPLPALIALRMTSVVAGLAVLVLVDRRLVRLCAPMTLRWICLAAVVLCEWQTYTGAILHPDALLLACLLAMVLAFIDNRVMIFALVAVAAALAKPTGLLALGVGVVMVGGSKSWSSRRVMAPRGLMVCAGLVLVSSMSSEMVRAMAGFGRMDSGLAWGVRLGAGTLALLVMGGPLLLLLGFSGFRQRWRLLRAGVPATQTEALETEEPGSEEGAARHEETEQRGAKHGETEHGVAQQRMTEHREARISLALGVVLLATFAAAALTRGQFKANWVLPAAVLLLPVAPLQLRRRTVWALGTSSAAISVLIVAAHWFPSVVAEIETGSSGSSHSYVVHAGEREARVSSATRWSQRLAEYGDMSAFAEATRREWARRAHAPIEPEDGESGPFPTALVSNDYGLAAQLAWYWHNRELRLVLPGDGIYHRMDAQAARAESRRGLLVMAVGRDDDALWRGLAATGEAWRSRHPATRATLYFATARREDQGKEEEEATP